ncbi:MAG: glycosyltransferase, partial [Desulfatirhabdiaceae bacterium]
GESILIENSIFDDVRIKSGQTTPLQKQGKSAGPAIPAGNSSVRKIVYTGTLERYQGIDILMRAFALVQKKIGDVSLLIVGGTPGQVGTYQNLARELDVHDRVCFTGMVSKSDASGWTKQADVLVSPRSDGTNTPLKLYEQIASGIPLVATRIYSHTQVLRDDMAFLVKPNPHDMAQGILEALLYPEVAREKARTAQNRYEEQYSPRIYTGKMKYVLESLSPCVE